VATRSTSSQGYSRDRRSGPAPASRRRVGRDAVIAVVAAVFSLGQPSELAAAPPGLSLSADRISVATGHSVELSWQAEHVDGCLASGDTEDSDWAGDKGTSGTEMVSPSQPQTTYTLTCSGQNHKEFTASVTVSVTDATDANNAPAVTSPVDQTNAEGDSVNLQIVASDADGDPLSYSASGLPAGLSLGRATGLISGTLTSDAVTSSSQTVTVTVGDGTTSTPVTFSWTVTAADHQPVAKLDSVTIDEGQTAHIDVLSNDSGLGDGGLILTISAPAQNGLASVDTSVANFPTVTYVPDTAFTGQDSFQYRVTDANGDLAEASVSIQVNCTSCAYGVTLILSWDPNPQQEAVTGYKVFFDQSAAADSEIANIPVTANGFDPTAPSIQYDVGADLDLRYGDKACFRVKAYNDLGESDFSQAACAIAMQ
jgi:hypothetical protein